MEDLKFSRVEKRGKTDFKFRDLLKVSKIDTISPPSVFIGSALKYPLMNVGILSPLERSEDASVYDDCKLWADKNFGISDVLNLRGSLLNSRFLSRASDCRTNKKFTQIAKDIAISSKPVDVGIELNKSISPNLKRDRVYAFSGMSAPLKSATINSNLNVSKFVDYAINDEIKAKEGISYLYKKNLNEYSLSKILSVGVLGLKKDKKFVPTRWSITATDDMICLDLLKKVKEYKEIENFSFSFGEFLGNQYLIFFFPNVFSFELFELYFPGSSWNPSSEIKASTDFEDFFGRKNYASNCVGGYYATRLAIVEYLESIKKQAGVLVIRLETPTYWASLGVWVVRESVRKALAKGVMNFESRSDLLNSGKQIGKVKYNFDCEYLFSRSKLLNEIMKQKRLDKWF
jgi:hypothetical protein